MFKKKYHWWCLTFISPTSAGFRISSYYIGTTKKRIRVRDVKEVQRFNNIVGSSILSCTYLEKMTKDEFEKEGSDLWLDDESGCQCRE